ncbi:hypothetical protein [Natrinema pallidum]|uniref:Uncharacterized protein n=1 Tax=Natrinema pallidum DSM 3751 TaxID=1227495 RepID=L9Z8A5_9EURY|nr:hypothetical protein [Natrinema pallidum]ELY82579.1 hypothetical protein C487_01470 [Natrinema pallidum DSM 3751]
MSSQTRSDDGHSEIATQLAIRLVLVFAVAGFCTWVLLPWPSALSVPLVLVVDLIALWVSVHYVFAALNDLLEVKLADLNRPSRSGD